LWKGNIHHRTRRSGLASEGRGRRASASLLDGGCRAITGGAGSWGRPTRPRGTERNQRDSGDTTSTKKKQTTARLSGLEERGNVRRFPAKNKSDDTSALLDCLARVHRKERPAGERLALFSEKVRTSRHRRGEKRKAPRGGREKGGCWCVPFKAGRLNPIKLSRKSRVLLSKTNKGSRRRKKAPKEVL